jgi:hypothetical protein
MDRTPVHSSNVAAVGYDPQTLVLEVAFRNGGLYAYQNVRPETYAALLASPSIGAFIHHSIKPWHTVIKLPAGPADPASQRERLAAVSHEIWSHWMRWMFTQGQREVDGSWTMPTRCVQRWTRQMETEYADLTEPEKDSDREQADKILDVVGAG